MISKKLYFIILCSILNLRAAQGPSLVDRIESLPKDIQKYCIKKFLVQRKKNKFV